MICFSIEDETLLCFEFYYFFYYYWRTPNKILKECTKLKCHDRFSFWVSSFSSHTNNGGGNKGRSHKTLEVERGTRSTTEEIGINTISKKQYISNFFGEETRISCETFSKIFRKHNWHPRSIFP